MRILALDTAVAACSAAVWDDGQVRAEEQQDLAYGHAEILVPMLARVLARAGVSVGDMDRLACTIGPGHFTGLRAGLAAARGLALAAAKPLIGITTLDAVAAGVTEAELAGRDLIVALDSKRAEAYVQRFDAAKRARGAAAALTPAALAGELGAGNVLVAGDAAAAVAQALNDAGGAAEISSAPRLPQARLVAELAATRAIPSAPPAPFYLHPPAITQPKRVPVLSESGAP
jgi:tRNA threonylcarbamoyladenosine biosynthesis protein TsaB